MKPAVVGPLLRSTLVLKIERNCVGLSPRYAISIYKHARIATAELNLQELLPIPPRESTSALGYGMYHISSGYCRSKAVIYSALQDTNKYPVKQDSNTVDSNGKRSEPQQRA